VITATALYSRPAGRRQVKDVLRYTALFSTETYTDAVWDMVGPRPALPWGVHARRSGPCVALATVNPAARPRARAS
jgi:hypothetical protein